MDTLATHPTTALAWRMLVHQPRRLVLSVLGVAVAFFLAAAQTGLLVGWCNTCAALISHSGADIWIMAEQTPAFDYGTAIPRQRIYQTRSVPGVAHAEGLFMGWNVWQRRDGRRVNVALVGLDDGLRGGPWKMREGQMAAVHQAETVLVDEMFCKALQVDGIGTATEMFGLKAKVGGITQDVRTFTASPYVFTSIASALRYDKRYRSDEITYVLVTCEPSADPSTTAAVLRKAVPNVEVLTNADFVHRTVSYWMLETGVGITVVLTAILGLAVGSIIFSQTLFAITQEFLPNYATLLAIGFDVKAVMQVVYAQSLFIAGPGIILGGGLFGLAAVLSARTQIPLETTPLMFGALVIVSLLACLAMARLSARVLYKVDPVTVFRQ